MQMRGREMDKSWILSSAEAAANSDMSNLSDDRIEALAGGHGMINIALFAVADTVAQELLRGNDLKVRFANVRSLPVDEILKKAIDAAKACGADGANAALVAACMMYLAGSAAQVGIPAGNRKLGATARMLAGVDRCGVSAVPTGKMNSKVSGFPAVLAVNQALMNGTICSVKGRELPANVGGCIYGHSALGEDYIWPELAEKGARVGTQAMLDSMSGAGIRPNPFYAAVLGSAAILEIIHPDAEVPEGEGKYGRTSSVYLVGRSAAKTAGLPEKLHMRVTGEEYDTAQVVGDVGLILKDIGGPSVVGMMAFAEIFGCFRERLSGASTAPFNSALGHVTAYTMVALRAMEQENADLKEIGRAIVRDRMNDSVNPESAIFSINTMAKKAAELTNGPITRMLIEATEPVTCRTKHRKAAFAYDELSAGKTLAEVVEALDRERVAETEENANRVLSAQTGEKVTVKFRRIEAAARRTGKVIEKYWAFDPNIDIDITCGEKTAEIRGFTHELLPKIAFGDAKEYAWAVPLAAVPTAELMLCGCNILNIVMPAAVAAAMGLETPDDAAAKAEAAAYITRAIPGGKAAAARVAALAKEIAAAEE